MVEGTPQPDDGEPFEFVWDERNSTYASRHGLTPLIAAVVADRYPKLFVNRLGRTGTHMMIGTTEDGEFWTIILVEVGSDRWRPINGWKSSKAEIELYIREGR
jgi:hypothetical protein